MTQCRGKTKTGKSCTRSTKNKNTKYCWQHKKGKKNKIIKAEIELPLEMWEQIMLELPPKDLLELCKTNKMFSSLCSDIRFKKFYKKSYNDKKNILEMAKDFRVGYTRYETKFKYLQNQKKIFQKKNINLNNEDKKKIAIYNIDYIDYLGDGDIIQLKNLVGLGKWTIEFNKGNEENWKDEYWENLDEYYNFSKMNQSQIQKITKEYIDDKLEDNRNNLDWLFRNMKQLYFQLYDNVTIKEFKKKAMVHYG